MNTKKTITLIVFIAFLFLISFLLFYFSLFVTSNKVTIEGTTVDIYSKVSGKITELNVENNSKVQKGEILLQIDSSEYQSILDTTIKKLEELKSDFKISSKDIDKINKSINEAKSGIKEAKLNLENANNDYVRYKNAFKDGSVTEKDLNNAIKNLEVARSRYILAQENLEKTNKKASSLMSEKSLKNDEIKKLTDEIDLAKLNLANATIIAPIEGIIINKEIETGKEIKANDKLLSIISDNLYIIAEFSENEIKKIKQNQTAKIKTGNKVIEGKIINISGLKAKINPEVNVSDFILLQNQKLSVQVKIK